MVCICVYLISVMISTLQLLIGFESGQLVIWDLKLKVAEIRFQAPEPLRSVSWHSDGKQFMCSHSDGSLTTFNVRVPSKPVGLTLPHCEFNLMIKLCKTLVGKRCYLFIKEGL